MSTCLVTDYVFYLLLGSGAAAIIAALGLGLVVTYQGSGIVNFAYGGMAMWTAFVYADLRTGAYPFPVPGLPARYHFGGDVGFRWAFFLAMATAAAVGLIVYLLVFRPLRRAPALARVVASVGLVIVFTSLVQGRFGDTTVLRVPSILPRESVTIAADLTVPRDGLWLAVIVLVITFALWTMLRFTRIGMITRAASENEKGAVLLGFSPELMAGLSFVVAAILGGFIAILGGATEARILENRDLMLATQTSTFHGRDIFAPVAAHLAVGTPFESIGSVIDPGDLVQLRFPTPTMGPGTLETSIAFIDSFGNLRLFGTPDDLESALGTLVPGTVLSVAFGSAGDRIERPTWTRTFGEIPLGEALMYRDSSGWLAFADNQGDAARRLGLASGDLVRIHSPRS